MDKKSLRNPPDCDERVPPPPYTESENTAYNPAYLHSNRATPSYPSYSTQTHEPSAPPSPQQHQSLYPQLPSPSQRHIPQSPPTQAQVSPHQYSTYQTVLIPDNTYYRIRQQPLILRDFDDRRFPMAALFFLFGWLCPLLWVMGACCCAGSRNRYEAWWGKVNFFMAVVLILSSIVYSMVAIAVGDWNYLFWKLG
ncbi:hypothetical protein EC973_009564 [Apophysomyces ossiformis]|uniref:Uncharacterized protein n=1 Tax=Apophysomyces ossiformis TaxID=679940 RepID=A0A8H7BRV1_9FUNG|nr:hypothetical protein EC973_009564 [Apophysomyces ossiformis]